MRKWVEQIFRVSRAGKAVMKTAVFSVVAAALLGFGLSAGCGDSDDSGDEPLLLGYSVLNVDNLREMVNAVKFAAEDINAAGGNVRLVDTELDDALIFRREDPVATLRKFTDMGIKGLVGPTSSTTARAIHSFVTDNELVAVATSVSSSELSELNEAVDGQHYLFRTHPHNEFLTEVLADEAGGEDKKVAIIYIERGPFGEDASGKDINMRIRDNLAKTEFGGRTDTISVPLDLSDVPTGEKITDAQAARLVAEIERVPGIRDVDSIIIEVYLAHIRILEHLQDSTVIPADARYFLGQSLTYSDHLHSWIAAEDEDPESDEVKARLEGVTGVIPYPHSRTHSHADLRNFECRFSHDIVHVEEALHYTTYAYDATVVMALAALKAGSTDPSIYVREIPGVTEGGTECSSYAECRKLLTDGDDSNDDIDYDGLSGPIELDERTGNVTDAFFAVYTYDGTGGRTRRFDEVRDGELLHPDNVVEPDDRPLSECPDR